MTREPTRLCRCDLCDTEDTTAPGSDCRECGDGIMRAARTIETKATAVGTGKGTETLGLDASLRPTGTNAGNYVTTQEMVHATRRRNGMRTDLTPEETAERDALVTEWRGCPTPDRAQEIAVRLGVLDYGRPPSRTPEWVRAAARGRFPASPIPGTVLSDAERAEYAIPEDVAARGTFRVVRVTEEVRTGDLLAQDGGRMVRDPEEAPPPSDRPGKPEPLARRRAADPDVPF